MAIQGPVRSMAPRTAGGRTTGVTVGDVGSTARAADLAISASLRDFIALWLREEDPDTLFFARRLTIEGDTDLGLTVKNLLDGIDWESALGRLLPPFLRPGAGH